MNQDEDVIICKGQRVENVRELRDCLVHNLTKAINLVHMLAVLSHFSFFSRPFVASI